jgi:hypothetical protein
MNATERDRAISCWQRQVAKLEDELKAHGMGVTAGTKSRGNRGSSRCFLVHHAQWKRAWRRVHPFYWRRARCRSP